MADVQRVGDLEIAQDIGFQHRQWAVQRIGWAVLALTLLAALLGLLGQGPLSSATAEAADGSLRLDYDRFLHFGNATTLRIRLDPAVVTAGEVRLWVNEDFLQSFQLRHMAPQPEHMEAAEGRHIFVFRAASTGEPLTLFFVLEPCENGPLECRLGLAGREEVRLWQFVYP